MDIGLLYAEYADAVRRFVYTKTHDSDLAQDVTQETFLHVCKRPRYQDPDKPLSYLRTIAHHLLIDYWRAHGRTEVPINDRVAVNPYAEVDTRILVAELMEPLTDAQQEALVMRARGYTDLEIAEGLGVDCGAVRALRFRGLHRMQRAVRREEREGKRPAHLDRR